MPSARTAASSSGSRCRSPTGSPCCRSSWSPSWSCHSGCWCWPPCATCCCSWCGRWASPPGACRTCSPGAPLLWFKVEAVMLASLLLGALWYAPVAASFLVVSAWARRSPIMWVTLAPIVAMVVEWKIGTHYVANFLYYRTFGIWEILGMGHSERLEHGATPRGGARRPQLRGRLHQPEPVARGAGGGRAAVRRGARAPLPGRHRRLSRPGRRGALSCAASPNAAEQIVHGRPGMHAHRHHQSRARAVHQRRRAGARQARRRAGRRHAPRACLPEISARQGLREVSPAPGDR